MTSKQVLDENGFGIIENFRFNKVFEYSESWTRSEVTRG